MHIFKQNRGRSTNMQRRQSRWRFGTKSAKNFQNRIINIGHREQDFENKNDNGTEDQIEFVDNTIKSSKYTLLTFLPK